jgi:hypothetical protein
MLKILVRGTDMKTRLFIFALLFLTYFPGCKKKTLTEWPPRTGLHDVQATKEINAELKNEVDIKTNIFETTDGSGGFKINKESSKISGTVKSRLGSTVREARFGAFGDIFSDPVMTKHISDAYLLTSGEILLPVSELFNEPPHSAYVQNRFDIIDFGPRYVLLNLDPAKKHQLAFIPGEDGFIGTTYWLGTKAEFQNNIVERKEDGWYAGTLKLKERIIEPTSLVVESASIQETEVQHTIELAIALWFDGLPGCQLSPSLRQKVDQSKLRAGFFLAPESPLRITEDGVRLKLPADYWTEVPQNFTVDSQLSDANGRNRPEATVKMRGGEIGISNGSVFATESTQAKVEEQEYVFREGKWIIRN